MQLVHSSFFQRRNSQKPVSRGFTLLELLVVIAVMALMMGLVGFSLLGGGGSSLDAAQRELVSLVQQARQQATLSGKEIRLIVHDDPADREKFHRYMEMIQRDANGTWQILGEGVFLADQVYFVPSMERFSDSAETSSDEGWPTEAFTVWSGDSKKPFSLGEIKMISMDDKNLAFREEDGENPMEYRYLAFDGEGRVTCASGTCAPGGTSPPPTLVLAIGSPNPSGDSKAIRFDNPNDLAGVLLRRYGGVATLSYEDIAN
jgi:prepilin-type N-terminal cleavage/methylation domain-containing protein